MRATIRLCIVYGGIKMADYQKMYTLLCSAIDSVLDGLQEIPLARPYVYTLSEALLKAEDIYIETAEGEE